jgi:hypothetical protein
LNGNGSIALNPIRVSYNFFPEVIKNSIKNMPEDAWQVMDIEDAMIPGIYFNFTNLERQSKSTKKKCYYTGRVRKFDKAGIDLYEVFMIIKIDNEAEWDWVGSETNSWDMKQHFIVPDWTIRIAQTYLKGIKQKEGA